jgi:hypothetical protein
LGIFSRRLDISKRVIRMSEDQTVRIWRQQALSSSFAASLMSTFLVMIVSDN